MTVSFVLAVALLVALGLLVVVQLGNHDLVADLRKERTDHDKTRRALDAVEAELAGARVLITDDHVRVRSRVRARGVAGLQIGPVASSRLEEVPGA